MGAEAAPVLPPAGDGNGGGIKASALCGIGVGVALAETVGVAISFAAKNPVPHRAAQAKALRKKTAAKSASSLIRHWSG